MAWERSHTPDAYSRPACAWGHPARAGDRRLLRRYARRARAVSGGAEMMYFAVISRYGRAFVIRHDDRRNLAAVFGFHMRRDSARRHARRINARLDRVLVWRAQTLED